MCLLICCQVVHSASRFTREGVNLVRKLTSLWEEFVVQVDDAVEHVTLQTPVMIETFDGQLQVETNSFICVVS